MSVSDGNMEARRIFVIQKLCEAFRIPAETVESAVREYSTALDNFITSPDPQVLTWFYQVENDTEGLKLFPSSISKEPLLSKAVIFARSKASANSQNDVSFIEVLPNMVATLPTLLQELFGPLVDKNSFVNSIPTEEEDKEVLPLKAVLRRPDAHLLANLRAAADPLNVSADQENISLAAIQVTELLSVWCSSVDSVLSLAEPLRMGAGVNSTTETLVAEGESRVVGILGELTQQQHNVTVLKSVARELVAEDVRAVCAAASVVASSALKKWRDVEAKLLAGKLWCQERAEILAALHPSLQFLESGAFDGLKDSLPSVFTHLGAAATASQVYSSLDELAALLACVASQLAHRGLEFVSSTGNLWDQQQQNPKGAVVGKFDTVIALYKSFEMHCRELFSKLPTADGISRDNLDLLVSRSAAPLAVLARRHSKVRDLVLASERFAFLGQHSHIPCLSGIAGKFNELVNGLKGRKGGVDLLNPQTCPEFDKDMLEFAVHVNDLEAEVQNALKRSFEAATSTEHALSLLRQYTPLLPADTAQAEVEFMYAAAFKRFAGDVDDVQALYEKHKRDPPLARGAPPAAGAALWARGLLHRIERPMKLFSAHQPLMAAKESKKAIKAYNHLAQALLEFEALWHAAWLRGTDAAVALLQAPVLVRHPSSGQLYVNLDAAVLRMLREARWFGRMGLPIPDPVKRTLLISESLNAHHAALASAVSGLAKVQAAVPPSMRALLQPHINAVIHRAEPGLSSVCWASATLDGFIHQLSQAVEFAGEVVRRAGDVHSHRLEVAIAAVEDLRFLDLSAPDPPKCAEFASNQANYIEKQSVALLQRDREAKAACEDVISLASKALQTRNHSLLLDPKACDAYKRHCCDLVRHAASIAVEATLTSLQARLGGEGGAPAPGTPTHDDHTVGTSSKTKAPVLVSFAVQLEAPNIGLQPPLDDFRSMLSSCSAQVHAVVSKLPVWEGCAGAEGVPKKGAASETANGQKHSLEMLYNAVESMKTAISAHIAGFDAFAFLWRTRKEDAYASFLEESPSLEDAELQIRKLASLQQDLDAVPEIIRVQAVGLETAPLKHAVRAEISGWKAQFSKTLHDRALAELKALEGRCSKLVAQLNRKVEDISGVSAVMQALQVAREEELDFERRALGIEEMYALLTRYSVPIPKEELSALGDLQYAQRAVRSAMENATSGLSRTHDTFVSDIKVTAKSLVEEGVHFRAAWDSTGPAVPGLAPLEAAARLAKFTSDFEPLKRKWDKVVAGEALFGLPSTSLAQLQQSQEDISVLEQLYTLYTAVLGALKERGAQSWVDAMGAFESMAAQVADFQNQSRRMPKVVKDWPAYKDCRKLVDDLVALMPLFEGLAQKAVKDRHWVELGRVVGAPLPLPSEGLLLNHLLEAGLLAHREEVEDLCSSVVKEQAVEKKLKAVADQWAGETFTFADHKQRGPVILKPAETAELMERLEDSTMVLGSLAASRYSAPFRSDVQTLAIKLGAVGEVMEQWLAVQSMWSYMEAVFSGGDIVKQLPAEAKRFSAIDKNFMKAVAHARETGRVLEACTGSDALRAVLPTLLEQLELCQKSLSAYLEAKRAEFPRFYFVSDPTLLEILSLGSDPAAVVPHFQSGLFDSLANVTFDPSDKFKITEMWSREGEKVALSKPVDARGSVEVWLQRLVTGMQETVRAQIRRTAAEAGDVQDLGEFLFNRPAQVALLGLQLRWTSDTLAALQAASKEEKGALTKALKRAEATLRDLVSLALRSDLTRLQRTSLETCITVHMHQKEATEELVAARVRDPRDFRWLKQCRFTWRSDRDTVMISICDVDLEYSYEYLGVKERLVITPLTDVCYVTLTQALGMFLGGAPAGPAGTGKTETTKDLGATLGKYVVVFNCSDQMDYKGMGKIFKGLAQSGLWGCFDEFNRINLDVLSVCAQQVGCVLNAVRERRKSFTFTDGTTVPLDPRLGFFITMNPGYAGRQELPENLKALFRGVTMMVPNRQTIMKVKLAAAGFQDNEALAKKFHVLYALCEQQLSKQPHYDFGLRNILSVLRTAGASKRANPTMSETEIIMRTLRDMNMSKFVADDVPLFLALIEDLFPGQRAERAPAADVASALDRVCKDRGFQAHAPWITKCMQLYETSLVRHGIMVVGPAGSGKSSAVDCLAAALTDLGQKTVVWRMNPKAITAQQMFGRMDAATGDWTDGVFATLWRRAAKAPKGQSTWIVLDGPVDAVWIENLNTVLDDNKVLTLANGDRVLMTPHMRLVFEAENLNNASPATVSRAGIIFLSGTELGWQPVADSWLSARPEREAVALKTCFDRFVAPALEFVRLQCAPVVHNEAVCQVGTLLTLLTGILGASTKTGAAAATEGATVPHNGSRRSSIQSNSRTSDLHTAPIAAAAVDAHAAAHAAQLLERHFLFCLAWSVGGLLGSEDRGRFDEFLRSLTAEAPPAASEQTIYEFVVNSESGEWQHWNERIPAWKFPSNSSTGSGRGPRFTQMVVPTLDSVRYEHLLSLAHAAGRSSLLVGGPGTAKTTIVKQFLSRFDPDAHASKTITFSSLTTPALCQTALEGCVEKRQGRSYGPPGGKSATIFLDDLSMPAVNQWGDQITNELVRQVLEQGGFYSTTKPVGELKQLVDVGFVSAMSLPGSGRADIPNRLKRSFCIFHVPPPSKASITGVFGQIMSGHFAAKQCTPEVAVAAQRLVPATMQLWAAVQARMLPTPTKFHYTFTLRDLSKVFQGVLLADMGSGSSVAGGAAPQGVPTVEWLVTLWAHECRRVFADKLISQDERVWVNGAILEACNQHFGPQLTSIASEPAIFADFLRDALIDEATGEPSAPRPSCYETVPSGLPQVRARVDALVSQARQQCRPGEGPPELVLFDDALEHVLKLSRVLAMERGSALLVGVGGSGKQSLARVAAHLAGAACFKINLTKTYNVTNLLEDLKALYKQAAFKPQPVCFIITESDIKEETFLEYINQVLMTGEVAGLFPREELDALLNDIRPAMRAEQPGVPDTADNLYAFFMNRVRDRLHLVLCFSPVGPRFARWAQQFPGLINGCAVDWFLPWPQKALLSVSSKLLGSNTELGALPSSQMAAIQTLMASVHERISSACHQYQLQYRRQVHVTPKSYIASIEGFQSLHSKKLAHLRTQTSALAAGLHKMNSAKEDVARMRIELAVKNSELEVAGVEAARLLAEISESTAEAEKERGKVGIIVDGVRKKAEEIAGVKADAEADLQAAQPALEAALSALNSITSKDIVSLKALKSPPDVIKRIMDCVLLLRHFPVNKVAWQDIKGAKVVVSSYEEAAKMMGDMSFLQSLLNFPKESINDETVELLKASTPYFAGPDFNYESAKKASGAVAGLCNWAESMCKYHEVAKVVEPKIIKLRASEDELRVAEAERHAAEAQLAEVQAKLDAMQAKFDAAVANKAMLEADAASTQRKMDNAVALMGALGGEEARWVEQRAELEAAMGRLIGDCAVASTFLSYLGPFNRAYREQLLADTAAACSSLGLPLTSNLDVAAFLADDAELGQWAVEGLPSDALSVQNGLLVTRAVRCPLLIDPQGQGRSWLMRREAAAGLKVTRTSDKHFRNVLEDCLTTGSPLLIENVEQDLDPVLDAVLERRFVKKGRSVVVTLGDKEVDVGDGFRLFLTCRLPNPKFVPETFAKVSVVDFTVTPSGLEDQLLAALVLKERRELEEQRRRLVEEVQSYRRRVAQLESDLLLRLSSSSGNLLEDTALVEVLSMTKATATEVAAKMTIASETRRRITRACEEYRPAAHRAMLLYFLVAEFATVNCMYQTSLAQFTELFEASIDAADKDPSPARRVALVADHFTASLFSYVQRGLYERHKLVFAFMMANKIQVSAGVISPAEVDAFLRLGAAADAPPTKKKPREWVPPVVWRNVLFLADRLPDVFGSLPEILCSRDDAVWHAWYDQEAPEATPLPRSFEGKLSPFQHLCLVRAFREDRALVAAAGYVSKSIGKQFIEPVPTSLERAWTASKTTCPLVCLLSAGADPTKGIEDLAKKKKIKCLGVSMGQGQEAVARRAVATAAAEGHWVLLQNTHLGLGYLVELEQYLSTLTTPPHDAFRLWITAEPHPSFPIGLLHSSLKLTNEAPVGLRAGLRASYQWLSQDVLDAVPRTEWRQLLFSLCFLHSVVQERRKFGPIGWNVPYEFSPGDLAACVQFLQNHIQEMAARRASAPDWSTVRYMISNIQYGGRITDELDRCVMDAYAERYFHEGALEKGHVVYADKGSGGAKYTIPDGLEIEAFRSAIETLPLQEEPELFGLHSNADLTFRALQVAEAVAVVAETQPKDGGAQGPGSLEEKVDKMCESLLGKLPLTFKVEDTKEALRKLPGGATAPLNVHLRQEIERLNRVLGVVSDTMQTVRLAIAGSIALGDEVLRCMDALHTSRVPASWLKISWEITAVGPWFSELLQRHDQLLRWLTTGRPKSFWLPGFFNPQGFLTAVKQEVTRKHAGDKWALDDVVMVSDVTRFQDPGAVREAPNEGVFIHGLFLEGGSWNAKEGILVDPEPKKLFAALPVMHVTAVQLKDKKKSGFFEAPCYKVRRRTGANFVANFMLRTEEERSKWILRGAALLMNVE